MLDFLHRLLHRILQRNNLPADKDWQELRDFYFSSVEFLDVPSFIEKTKLRAKAMRVAKSKTDFDREKGK